MASVVMNAEPDRRSTLIVPPVIIAANHQSASFLTPTPVANPMADNGGGPASKFTAFSTFDLFTTAYGASPPAPTSQTSTKPSSSSTLNSSSTPSSNPTSSGRSTQSGSSAQSGSTGKNHSSSNRAIVGGVTGAAVIIILGLIVFCVMRRKRRDKTSRSASHENSSSCDILDVGRPQSIQFSPTPHPFLHVSTVENSLPSKKLILYRKRNTLVQNDQRNVEEAIDPFKDPVHVSSNGDEGQQVRDRLNHLETFTNRFEEELRQLGALAQSGQLSAEDRLRLEEITRNIGSMVPRDSGRDRSSLATNLSSGSSFSPPSYHTHGS